MQATTTKDIFTTEQRTLLAAIATRDMQQTVTPQEIEGIKVVSQDGEKENDIVEIYLTGGRKTMLPRWQFNRFKDEAPAPVATVAAQPKAKRLTVEAANEILARLFNSPETKTNESDWRTRLFTSRQIVFSYRTKGRKFYSLVEGDRAYFRGSLKECLAKAVEQAELANYHTEHAALTNGYEFCYLPGLLQSKDRFVISEVVISQRYRMAIAS